MKDLYPKVDPNEPMCWRDGRPKYRWVFKVDNRGIGALVETQRPNPSIKKISLRFPDLQKYSLSTFDIVWEWHQDQTERDCILELIDSHGESMERWILYDTSIKDELMSVGPERYELKIQVVCKEQKLVYVR